MTCSVKGCLNYKEITEGVSFHLFPKDHRLKEWLDALGKDKTCWQWTKSKLVCSKHFRDCDFLEHPDRIMLKADAVPSLHLNSKPPTSLRIQREGPGKNLQSSSLPSVALSDHSSILIIKCDEEHDSSQTENYSNLSDFSESELGDLTREESGSGFSCKENETLTPESNSESNSSSQRKQIKKFMLPRYFGDCDDSYMQTSVYAKRNWEMAKCRISQQKRKITALQQNVRRLRRKATTLNMLFRYLKDNGLVTEAGHAVIKAFLKSE